MRVVEDAVRRNCHDVIAECVVVGAGREMPSLLVESNNADCIDLKLEIVDRMRTFNVDRYPWEAIEDPRRITILPKGSLVRTQGKGNVS